MSTMDPLRIDDLARDRRCSKPDRDEPRLGCGYPLPCPYHTAVIVESEVPGFVKMYRWLDAAPLIAIRYERYLGSPNGISVRCIAQCPLGVWVGSRELPHDAPISAIRDAVDELTREAHCELEKLIFGDIQR